MQLFVLIKINKSTASIAKSNKQRVGTCLYHKWVFTYDVGYEQGAKADCEYSIENW